jgi:hypothetical protein
MFSASQIAGAGQSPRPVGAQLVEVSRRVGLRSSRSGLHDARAYVEGLDDLASTDLRHRES